MEGGGGKRGPRGNFRKKLAEARREPGRWRNRDTGGHGRSFNARARDAIAELIVETWNGGTPTHAVGRPDVSLTWRPTVDDSKRGKWIAVLVLIVAGGLFGRS